MLERCLEWRSNRGVPNFGTMDSKILRRKVGIYQKTTGKFNHHIFNRTAKLPNSERSSSSALQSPSHGFEFFWGCVSVEKTLPVGFIRPTDRTWKATPLEWFGNLAKPQRKLGEQLLAIPPISHDSFSFFLSVCYRCLGIYPRFDKIRSMKYSYTTGPTYTYHGPKWLTSNPLFLPCLEKKSLLHSCALFSFFSWLRWAKPMLTWKTNLLYIRVNYNDLTTTSLESWLVRGIILK